jgi:hypothetical protein
MLAYNNITQGYTGVLKIGQGTFFKPKASAKIYARSGFPGFRSGQRFGPGLVRRLEIPKPDDGKRQPSRLIRLNGGRRFYRQGGEGAAEAQEKRMKLGNLVLRDPLRASVVLFFFLYLFPYPVI